MQLWPVGCRGGECRRRGCGRTAPDGAAAGEEKDKRQEWGHNGPEGAGRGRGGRGAQWVLVRRELQRECAGVAVGLAAIFRKQGTNKCFT